MALRRSAADRVISTDQGAQRWQLVGLAVVAVAVIGLLALAGGGDSTDDGTAAVPPSIDSTTTTSAPTDEEARADAVAAAEAAAEAELALADAAAETAFDDHTDDGPLGPLGPDEGLADAGLSGNLVVLDNGGTVTQIDLATGERSRVRKEPGGLTLSGSTLHVFDDVAVLTRAQTVTVLDATTFEQLALYRETMLIPSTQRPYVASTNSIAGTFGRPRLSAIRALNADGSIGNALDIRPDIAFNVIGIDGSQAMVSFFDQNVLIDLDNPGPPEAITNGFGVFSQHGHHGSVVCAIGRSNCELDISGASAHRVASENPFTWLEQLQPHMSPTGEHLVYIHADRSTGRNMVMLTVLDLGSGEEWTTPLVLSNPGIVSQGPAPLAVSSDGSVLAFIADDRMSITLIDLTQPIVPEPTTITIESGSPDLLASLDFSG